MWGLESRESIHTLKGHVKGSLVAPHFPTVSGQLVVASNDTTLRMWNIPPTLCLPSIKVLSAGENKLDSF